MLKPKRLIDDCFLHDKDRLRHDEAISILRERLQPVVGSSPMSLSDVPGRILAENIYSPTNVPMHNNAAVDGYAFDSQDFDTLGGCFSISARITAGGEKPEPLLSTTAARIFTGAIMPAGADSVVMQEDCEVVEKDGSLSVIIPAGLKPGANWRKAGEDLAKGETVLTPGVRLRPQDIAAIASTGKPRIEVYDKLRIGLISTGNEIRRPGNKISIGQVYDSNHFLLNALLHVCNITVTDYGIVDDDEASVRGILTGAAADNDVLITTGGASRGEEDHIVSVLDSIGKRHMWQMAIKPGRPMIFGQIPKQTAAHQADIDQLVKDQNNDCLFFGLPGNPVAAMVCFLMYVKPALTRLGGGNWQQPVRYPLPALFEITSKKTDRREFLRGILSSDENGNLAVSKFQRDGSGLISSLRKSDGLIEINEETVKISKGQLVNFIPFDGPGIN